MKISLIVLLLCAGIFLGCGNEHSPEVSKYFNIIEAERKEKNDYMKNDANSPFNKDEKAKFEPLKYYDVDTAFVFKSPLNIYDSQDTVAVFDTKGNERKAVRYGYVIFPYEDKEHKINVYKGVSRTGETYYSIWFTDKTTGDGSYGVGRYIDFELNKDKNFIYTIDFNKAYNPYCAYSSQYACAIPTREDYIDIAVTAGEKSFH